MRTKTPRDIGYELSEVLIASVSALGHCDYGIAHRRHFVQPQILALGRTRAGDFLLMRVLHILAMHFEFKEKIHTALRGCRSGVTTEEIYFQRLYNIYSKRKSAEGTRMVRSLGLSLVLTRISCDSPGPADGSAVDHAFGQRQDRLAGL